MLCSYLICYYNLLAFQSKFIKTLLYLSAITNAYCIDSLTQLSYSSRFTFCLILVLQVASFFLGEFLVCMYFQKYSISGGANLSIVRNFCRILLYLVIGSPSCKQEGIYFLRQLLAVFQESPSQFEGKGRELERSWSSRQCFIFINLNIILRMFAPLLINNEPILWVMFFLKAKVFKNLIVKAYKSVKVRNLLTIETTQRRYLDWQNSLQNYLERVSRQALILRNQINEFFWLPISQKYRFNNNAAGQVLLQFPCGFRRLSQVICLADAQNQPFLIQSLWNLLFTLSNLVNKLGNSLHQTILCSNRIFVDKQLKKIKICTPLTDNYQLFSRQSQNHDQQNEISITGKIKGNKQMLQVSKDLLLGNLLAQCVLLESQSSQNHNILNQQRQITQKKIKRVLKVEYYPLKLRIIVAGLMQLEHRSRFTTVEVCQLLSPYQQQIKPFFVFHQRKTDFIKVFGKKLKAMQNFLPENLWKYSTLLRVDKDKLNNKNDNYQPQCINRIIPKKSITKVNRPVPLTLNNIQTHKSNRDAQMLTLEQGSPTKTLNLSISSLPRYPKKDDSSSLNYSKSDCRSPRSNFSESMVRQNSLILEEASSAEGSKYDLPLKAQQQQIVQAKNKNISNDFGFEKILMPIQQQPFQSYKVIEISQKNRKQPLGIFRIDSLETHQIYGKHYNVIQGETKNSIQEKASYFQRNEVSQRQPQGLFTEIAQKNQKQDYQKSESLYQDKISSKYSFVENGNKTQSIIDRLDDFNTTKQIHQGVDFCNPLQGSSSCQLFEFKNQSQAAKEEILLDCDSLSQGFKQAMIKKMKMIEESVARSQQQFPSNK